MAYSIASSHFVETVQVMRGQYQVTFNPASHGGITIDEESELPPSPTQQYWDMIPLRVSRRLSEEPRLLTLSASSQVVLSFAHFVVLEETGKSEDLN